MRTLTVASTIVFLGIAPCLFGQVAPSSPKPRIINVIEHEKSIGDAPADPGPLATDVSGEMQPAAIKAAMRKVADWQNARIADTPSQNWTFPPLYDGLLAASKTLHDPRYHNTVVAAAEHFHWTIGVGNLATNANEHALGYPYIKLYEENPVPNRIADLKREFEEIKEIAPPDTKKDPRFGLVWWWCDALFMAPPTWSALSHVTHDPRYLNYMDAQYHQTDDLLWNKQYHLYFRDRSFFTKTEANGKPIFWSRGNGWVLAGLAMTLENIPANDPRRAFYLQRFKEISAEVLSIQSADGLWRTGLLDADAYKLPEVSGSAFFLYALTWGVNHHVLDSTTYKPAIARGWSGLVAHIYADGRLGSIQPIGDSPGKYSESASYVYGTGAFLLAGSEIELLARTTKRK